MGWNSRSRFLFFGDDVQLPPVLDSPVYHCKSKLHAAIHGILVWQEFIHAVTMKTSIRQGSGEEEFHGVLSSLWEYKASAAQA